MKQDGGREHAGEYGKWRQKRRRKYGGWWPGIAVRRNKAEGRGNKGTSQSVF